MRILKLEYYDKEEEWQLEPVEFSEGINLLVGVSGAGKTKILTALRSLKAIANGNSLNGVKWSLSFVTKSNINYNWSGEFEIKENTSFIDDNLEDDDNVKIVYEELKCDDTTLVTRTSEKIFFKKKETPKLSPYDSVIELLKQEDDIIPVKKELDKIILIDSDRDVYKIWRFPISILEKYETSSFFQLKESDLPIPIKFAIINRLFPEEFKKIKDAFKSIFNNIIDIKIETPKYKSVPIVLSALLEESIVFNIKEKGIDNWIDNISSGMFKTLMYISELYLSPENSVILIDEFENSLGINCIDSVTDLVWENTNLQFIVTSHHPYIINNISPKYWKIVTRKGNIVTVKDAKDFHIPDSRKKAFIDLINILKNEDDDCDSEDE
ncbi:MULTISPECIES: AAA family ATPase [unclassified Roseofilum]|uniref:AAA family ATPase n=1 Tax=unclassified Roseofilum TaxID=2620099 RepID=UPI001B1DD7CD|nr:MULTISPECIES: AAA family ATPase [unclassified Roseofilum]MBP0010739.1 AAA family ATPase [Roseofilum sp. Belize Diploria]MBP0035082.1 AAA family ATPase [Roseofilum sp. Belize BBD 4]